MRGGHAHPTAQQSFGVGNSEEGGKAVPASCRKCLLWPLRQKRSPLLFPQGLPMGLVGVPSGEKVQRNWKAALRPLWPEPPTPQQPRKQMNISKMC